MWPATTTTAAPRTSRSCRRLGVGAYRFSLAWPRVAARRLGRRSTSAVWPSTTDWSTACSSSTSSPGSPSTTGTCRRPWRTPAAGPNRDTAYRFAEYAAIVHDAARRPGPVCITLNEPWCSAFLGYAGRHARAGPPGRRRRRSPPSTTSCSGTGSPSQAMRSRQRDTPLGITLNVYPVEPGRPTARQDVDAARRIDGLSQPDLPGPPAAQGISGRRRQGPRRHHRLRPSSRTATSSSSGRRSTCSGRTTTARTSWPTPRVRRSRRTRLRPARPPGRTTRRSTPTRSSSARPGVVRATSSSCARDCRETQMGWEVEPQGLRRVLNRLTDDYDCPPLYVTENGAAYEDHLVRRCRGRRGAHLLPARPREGDARDHRRRGRPAGLLPLDACSTTSSGRWGYDRRFGAVHVDFETQARTPKRSALWYGELARTNTVPPLRGLPLR